MQSSESYIEWLKKFERVNGSDECYTPPAVYDAVLRYCFDRYDIADKEVIRPFYPNGDFTKEEYANKVVIDNPPFSLLSQIVRFYQNRGIPFFLFCDARTALGLCRLGTTAIFVGAQVTYDNGAVINTAFITNMEPDVLARGDCELSNAIAAVNINKAKPQKKYVYDERIMIFSEFQMMIKGDCSFEVRRDEGIQSEFSELYGGVLVLTKAKAEAKAEVKAEVEAEVKAEVKAEAKLIRPTYKQLILLKRQCGML